MRLIALIVLLLPSLCFAASLPMRADNSRDYLRVRSALGFIESRNNPAARNRVTTASGKYQFIKAWDKFFLREVGTSWTSVVPTSKASKSTTERLSKEQDRLFNRYYDMHVRPWIEYVRKRHLAEKYEDYELLAMAHRQGTNGAEHYLKTGKDRYSGKNGNRHITSHLRAMRKAMQFERYLDSQAQLIGG